MRRYSVLLLLLTLAFGVCGFSLRRYQLETAFEPLTGLAVRGAPATFFLVILTVFFLLFSVVFAVITSKSYRKPHDAEEAFGTFSALHLIIQIPVWAGWVCGTVMYLPGFISSGVPLTDIYFTVTSVLAAVSLILFNIGMYQDPKQKSLCPLSVVPVVFLCFWLILIYRDNASNPILLAFVYQILAVTTATLGFYYTAGFVFGKPAPGRTIISYMCTVFFCGITLADSHGTGVTLILCALAANAAISLFLLLRNLRH